MIGRLIIIFDLDGTLYDISDVIQMSYDMQVEFLSKKKAISHKEATEYLTDNHIYPIVKKDSRSATELFLRIGIDKSEWAEYRDANFNVQIIDKSQAVNEKVIGAFSKIGSIVLLSSNAYDVIRKVLDHIDVSSDIFDEIICSDRFPYQEPFTKKRAIEYLSIKYHVPFTNIISIGDRYETDIKPAILLGCKGLLVKSPQSLSDIFMDLTKDQLGYSDTYLLYY